MNWTDAMSTAIEVSIAIAGFAGIATGLVSRRRAWTVTDRIRLQMLLTASAAAMLMGMLPFILVDAGLEHLVWRIGSGLQLAWMLVIMIFRGPQRRRFVAMNEKLDANERQGFPVAKVSAVMVPTWAVVAILNVAWLDAFWPYLLGVAFQMTVAFAAFIELVSIEFREPNDG